MPGFYNGDDEMPRRPNVPCKHPGCAKLIPYDQMYCEEHKKLHVNNDRAKTAERGYGGRWQRESKQFLREHPVCAACFERGIITEAEVVDHIIPHRGDMKLFWDRGNWQALCKPCHDNKTLNEDINPEYKF